MPYQQQTLAALQTALKASWEGAPFWSDTEAKRFLNHALRTWNLLTGMWKARMVVTTVAGAHFVSLPSPLVYGMAVIWGVTGKALQLSAMQDLDYGRRRWEEEGTADGGDVPTRPQLWAPSGLTEIAIWPADAVGGNPLVLDGVSATPTLVNQTDFVDMGSHDATAVVRYALHIASFKRGIGAAQSTMPYFSEFIQAAMAQNQRLGYSGYFRKFMGLDFTRGMRPVVNTLLPAGGQERGGQGTPQ